MPSTATIPVLGPSDNNHIEKRFGSSSRGSDDSKIQSPTKSVNEKLNDIAFDFPPSQRQIFNWDEARERLHDNVPAIFHKTTASILCKRPAVNKEAATATSSRSSSTAEDVLRQKKRRLLEMDDWTGVKALAAQKPPKMHFPQYGDNAPVWGWSMEVPAGSLAANQSQPRSSYLPTTLDSYSVKTLSQYKTPTGRDAGRSSELRSLRDSMTSTSHRGQESSSISGYTPLVSALEGDQRSESIHSIHSPVAFPPTASTHYGMRSLTRERPSIKGHSSLSSSRQLYSSEWQQTTSQAVGSQTSPYFAETEPSTSSSGRSRITTPSHMSSCRQSVISGTLSEAEQERFESEGLAILSPSVPAMSGTVSGIAVGESVPPLTHVRHRTPSDIEPNSHVTPTVYQQSPSLSCDANEGAFESEEPRQETYEENDINEEITGCSNLDRRNLQEAIPENLQSVQLDEAFQMKGELPVDTRPSRESVPVDTRSEVTLADPSPTAELGDGVDLFSASRIDIRSIPDWNDSDDPIEDSEESETEAIRKMLKTTGTGQRRAGISGSIVEKPRR